MANSVKLTLQMSDCDDNQILFEEKGVGENIVGALPNDNAPVYYCKIEEISDGRVTLDNRGKAVLDLKYIVDYLYKPTFIENYYLPNDNIIHSITINWDSTGEISVDQIDKFVFEPYIELESQDENSEVREIRQKYSDFLGSVLEHQYELPDNNGRAIRIDIDFEDIRGNHYKIYTVGLVVVPTSISTFSETDTELGIHRSAYSGSVASVVMCFENTSGNYTGLEQMNGKPIISILS